MANTIFGMNHITLAVKDIARSFAFYHQILGLRPLVRWDKGTYFLAGEFWFCLNVSDDLDLKFDYTHYAFSVTKENFTMLVNDIIQSGAAIFKDNTSSGDSLYFLDPDGHKLEIHVGDWKERILTKKREEGNWKNVEWFM